jgi:hypothetical protein
VITPLMSTSRTVEIRTTAQHPSLRSPECLRGVEKKGSKGSPRSLAIHDLAMATWKTLAEAEHAGWHQLEPTWYCLSQIQIAGDLLRHAAARVLSFQHGKKHRRANLQFRDERGL